MSAKASFSSALFFTVASACLVKAQAPADMYPTAQTYSVPSQPGTEYVATQEQLPIPSAQPWPSDPPIITETPAMPQMVTTQPPAANLPATTAVNDSTPTPEAPGALSSWITYTRPDCCGPMGGNGPIKIELFFNNGPTIPVGNFVSSILDTGWEVQGGGKSIFFNPEHDAAWTVSLDLSNFYNHARPFHPLSLLLPVSPSVPVLVPTTVHLRDLIRTYGDAGLGREWYLTDPANSDGCRIRAGFDAGGRLGTSKLEFREITHRTDTIYGVFTAAHADLEIPKGCCTCLIGFRAEWGYTWMDFLDVKNSSNLQDVNLLLTLGVRF